MDPLSKRLMWKVITELGHNKAIMVTTHYMEECEALCSRIGIMSQGRLVCLGSSQHLKSRFATGYPVNLLLPLPSILFSTRVRCVPELAL